MEFKVISRRKSHLQNSLRLRSPSIVLHFPKSARESFGERERERENGEVGERRCDIDHTGEPVAGIFRGRPGDRRPSRRSQGHRHWR
jgi:hypothetical protein